jgi:glutathione peroxidase
MEKKFYDFEAKSLQGKQIKMDTYKGKVLLVVNTASKCGLAPQFEGLEKLYQTYKDKGFEVLGFPCNQFADQEPGDEQSILDGCQLNYGVSFPMFAKVNVNGAAVHPLFKYLKNELRGTIGKRIKWNFTKFLIGSNGKPIKRFAPTTKPENIEKYIKEAFSK